MACLMLCEAYFINGFRFKFLRVSKMSFLTMVSICLSDVMLCRAWSWLLILRAEYVIYFSLRCWKISYFQELWKPHIWFTSNSFCCFPGCFFCKFVDVDTDGPVVHWLCCIDGPCRTFLGPASFLMMTLIMMISFHWNVLDLATFSWLLVH